MVAGVGDVKIACAVDHCAAGKVKLGLRCRLTVFHSGKKPELPGHGQHIARHQNTQSSYACSG